MSAPPTSLEEMNDRLREMSSIEAQVDAMNAEAYELRYENPSLAMEIAKQARKQAMEATYGAGEARAWQCMGIGRALLSQHERALADLEKAWELFHNLGNHARATECMANIATLYMVMSQYDIALEWQFRALREAERSGLEHVQANTLTNIGIIYAETEQFEEALNYHQRGLEVKRRLEDSFGIAASLSAIGEVFFKLGRLYSALEYEQEALEFGKTLGVKHVLGYPLLNIGLVRLNLGEYGLAEKALLKAERNFEAQPNKQALCEVKIAQSELYRARREPPHALQSAKTALDIAWEINSTKLQYKAHKALASSHEAAGDLEQAYRHLQAHSDIRGEVLKMNAEQTFKALQLHHQYERSTQEKEIYRLRNIELTRAKEAIESQKAELQEVLDQIEKSIDYASRIQRSMLPSEEMFQRRFNDYFVIYLPRDGVSGDFYWMTHLTDATILAAADCTGHGVPGALMSMLGYSLLKQIVNEMGYYKPDKILKILDISVRDVLCRIEMSDQVQDGMDISLLRYRPEAMAVDIAGAHNGLYHLRNQEMTCVRADRMGIGGGALDERMKRFRTTTLNVEPGDSLYLYSDGFADQFGWHNGRERKFGAKRLRQLLTYTSHLPMRQQRAKLVETLEEWRGNCEQLDDILLIGLRI